MDSKERKVYEKPVIEIIEMEMDGGLCAGGGTTKPGEGGGGQGGQGGQDYMPYSAPTPPAGSDR